MKKSKPTKIQADRVSQHYTACSRPAGGEPRVIVYELKLHSPGLAPEQWEGRKISQLFRQKKRKKTPELESKCERKTAEEIEAAAEELQAIVYQLAGFSDHGVILATVDDSGSKEATQSWRYKQKNRRSPPERNRKQSSALLILQGAMSPSPPFDSRAICAPPIRPAFFVSFFFYFSFFEVLFERPKGSAG